MTTSSASNTNDSLPVATLTVTFYSEFNTIATPCEDELDEGVLDALKPMSLNELKFPSSLLHKGDKAIIEHILIANNLAYNVKKIELLRQVEANFIYRVTISKAQQGNTLLSLGDTLFMNRKDGQGFDCITLISKSAPHYYKHLPYGMRPDSIKAIRELKVF